MPKILSAFLSPPGCPTIRRVDFEVWLKRRVKPYLVIHYVGAVWAIAPHATSPMETALAAYRHLSKERRRKYARAAWGLFQEWLKGEVQTKHLIPMGKLEIGSMHPHSRKGRGPSVGRSNLIARQWTHLLTWIQRRFRLSVPAMVELDLTQVRRLEGGGRVLVVDRPNPTKKRVSGRVQVEMPLRDADVLVLSALRRVGEIGARVEESGVILAKSRVVRSCGLPVDAKTVRAAIMRSRAISRGLETVDDARMGRARWDAHELFEKARDRTGATLTRWLPWDLALYATLLALENVVEPPVIVEAFQAVDPVTLIDRAVVEAGEDDELLMRMARGELS